jgi:hypothetical protein
MRRRIIARSSKRNCPTVGTVKARQGMKVPEEDTTMGRHEVRYLLGNWATASLE